ncbi:MAG: adenylate/guanylate cyclase domain-containing protein [Rhodospirillales bacterium]
MDFPVPENEPARVVALDSYHIVGTPPEPIFDDVAELAAQIVGCPVGIVNLISDTREWLKARYGLTPELVEMPRGTTCSTTLCLGDLLVVPDLSQDDRFRELTYVAGEPFCRFYAGMPLINPEGCALGTLCVVDFEPRQITFAQGEAIRRLARQVVAQLELRRNLLELAAAREALAAEKRKAQDLLLNILPAEIAAELEREKGVAPRYYDSTTIMFTDFKGFTRFAESLEPRRLVEDLHQYFSAFDEIVAGHRLEKLKTIGDAYMCAGGLPEPNQTHPVDACLAAIEIQTYMARMNALRDKMRLPPWELRIGIHTGSVMAGVVGKRKFTYDIWGDAVNVAALMEANGAPGRINLSESTYHRVKSFFETEDRGTIEAKNKGGLPMFFLKRIQSPFSRDGDGRVPNAQFATARSRLGA